MSDYSAVKEAMKDLPKDLKENASELLERMESVIEGIGDNERSWTPPFLKLIQPTSGDIPEGASMGSLCINTEVLTSKKKGEAVTLIPLRVWDSRQYWDPDPNNPNQLCNSPDAKMGYRFGKCYTCDYAKWIDGKGSACRKSKSFLAITSDLKNLVQIQFSKAQFKYGGDWENMLKKAAVSPYRRAYDISTDKNAKNPAYHMKAEPSSFRPDENMDPFLRSLFQKVGQDRKDMLERFYEAVRNRQNNPQNQDTETGPSENIEVQEVDGGLTGDSQVDENAKGYSI